MDEASEGLAPRPANIGACAEGYKWSGHVCDSLFVPSEATVADQMRRKAEERDTTIDFVGNRRVWRLNVCVFVR